MRPITDDDIRKLHSEALAHQDWAQAKICDVALGARESFGHWTAQTARAECERVIRDTRGQSINAALMKLRGIESNPAEATRVQIGLTPEEVRFVLEGAERPMTVADWQLIAKALEVYVEGQLVSDEDATQEDVDHAERVAAKALLRGKALSEGRVMP